jgi:hypothetical protein
VRRRPGSCVDTGALMSWTCGRVDVDVLEVWQCVSDATPS